MPIAVTKDILLAMSLVKTDLVFKVSAYKTVSTMRYKFERTFMKKLFGFSESGKIPIIFERTIIGLIDLLMMRCVNELKLVIKQFTTRTDDCDLIELIKFFIKIN